MPFDFNIFTGKFDVVKNVPLELGKVTKEPTGHKDINQSTISFSDTSPDRTFTITPTGDYFDIYSLGKKFRKTSAESVQITDTEGVWYIYYDSDGVLIASQTPWNWGEGVVHTALAYWDATNSSWINQGEERHGLTMSEATHRHFHESWGTRYISGHTPSVTVDGNGSLDAHAEIQAVSAGEIHDEDLDHMASEQTSYEIWYKDGASPVWRITSAGANAVDVTADRPNYNQFTGGAWQRTEVANTKFTLTHMFITNDINKPNILIMGENQYDNKNDAQTGATVEINEITTAGLPTKEFVAAVTLIVQCLNAYGNSYNARLVSTDEGGTFVDFREEGVEGSSGGGGVTDHGNLTGLLDDDHGAGANAYHTDTRADTWFTGKDLNDLGTKSHTSLTDKGTNTHPQIDTHVDGDGSDHADVATNTTHSGGDGSDHSGVATNTTHRGLTNDPHNVTATQVGLGNVTNVATDDTAYNVTSWNANTDSATKNAIRDKVETMDTAISSNTTNSHASGSDDQSAGDFAHNSLSGLNDGTSYEHITQTQKTALHAQSHNVASHSDTTATGAELNILTGGGDTTLHDHDGISENTTHRGLTNNPHSVDSGNVGLSNVTDVATDDTAYNTTSWNANLDSATKNAIRDKVETMDTSIGSNTTHSGGDGSDHSDVATNTSKVTNATHTGDVTGSTSLTLDKTSITGQATVTAVGADFVLISDTGDSSNLKKALVSDFGGGGINADVIVVLDGAVATLDGNVLILE